ncbi:hypothetical protein [Verrucomicrobium spinosum]|uniref:hypothetical protein n=1 Tax=Verrucomicrobium spinosum TaxID=2736 RepID=UPI00017452EC|nr:hypothetical protein [Verrucomicrobium spinosum]
MNAKQQKLYLSRWLAVKDVLVKLGGYSAKEAEAMRHEIHTEALGKDKSSKDFTNSDLDRVLDAFDKYLAISNPQVGQRAVEGPLKRAVKGVELVGWPEPYVQAVAMDKFGTAEWRGLDEEQLQQLKITLVMRRRAQQKRSNANH